MGSYDKDEFMGGLWDWQSDKGKLCAILAGLDKTRNAAAWGKVYEVLIPMYMQAVKDGKLPVYKPFTDNGARVERQLASMSALPEATVKAFMNALYSAATQQQVSMVLINPGVPGVEKGNIIEEGAKGAGSALKAGLTGVGEAGGAGVAALLKGAWPLVVGIVGVAAIMYAPAFVGIKRSISGTARKIKAKFSR